MLESHSSTIFLGSTAKMGAGTNFQKHLVALHHLDCPWRPRDIEQREGRILRGDPTINELDDISEISASYEDIASTAYENPLMSEEAKLSAQLRRLRYSKSIFAQQQRQTAAEQKKLTAMIPLGEKHIGNLKADIADKIDTKGDAFRMKIGDTVYTKRAEAVKVLDELIKNFRKESFAKVGEIGGFDIKLRTEHTLALRGGVMEVLDTRVFAQLANHGTHSVEPSLKSMEHFVSQGVEKTLAVAEATLKENQSKLNALNLMAITIRNRPDDKTFQACVNLVNSGIVKSSQSGNVDTTIKNFVDPQDLNSFQRAFATFAKEMGVPIVFFRGAKNFHGAHANGISFYNADANFSHEWVYWHEFGHWLKNNQPELFGKLSDAANVTDEQIAAKRKSRTELSDEELREEIICDAMGDVARRAGIFQQFAKKNQSLIQRLMSWAKSTLDKFTDWFHTRERGLTTAQRAKMYDAFGKIARQIEDADGRKIFRYNNRTHEVELATGEKLPETKNAAVTVTGDEFGEYSDIKDLRKKAIQYYKEHLQGTSVENKILGKIDIDENGLVEFTSAGRKKVESTSAQKQKLLLVKHLPQLIRDATEIQIAEPVKERHKDDIFYHMENIAMIGGENVPVHITLIKHNTGRIQFYNHTVEMENAPVNSAEPVSSNEALGLPPVGASSETTISQSERTDKPKYSLDAGDDESIFRRAWDKFAKALHLNGDKIVTQESQRREKLREQERAMADYLKEPTKENRQRLSKLGVTKAQLDAYQNGEEYATEIGLIQNYRSSPSRLAEKVATFRAFFRMGDRAMDKLVKLRDGFARKYSEAMNFVKSKEDREQLVQLLWDGDEEQREFGRLTDAELAKIKADNPNDTTKAIQRAKIAKLCDEADVSENVAKAYLAIRRQLERAYTLLDEARRRPQNYAKYLTAKQYERLRDNKFVKQGTLKIHDKQDADGNHLVTWTEYANSERKIVVDGSAAARFLSDDAIQILGERELEDGTFELEIREGIAPLNKLTGYVPHFFHQFTAVVRNADGKQVGNIIGTGRTQREAIKLAEDWQKNHRLKDGEQIFVLPHTFNFGMDENFTPIMGDKDFAVMMSRISQNTGLPLDEAKQIVKGAVKLKNRHRFLGQLLHRKGYAGYEKDMDWVLRHHFNTAARYVALETEFKPKVISLLERVFGAFDKDHSKNLLAQYTKDYINDVNGNPAWIDEVINRTLNQNSVWRKYFLPNVGERGAANSRRANCESSTAAAFAGHRAGHGERLRQKSRQFYRFARAQATRSHRGLSAEQQQDDVQAKGAVLDSVLLCGIQAKTSSCRFLQRHQ